MGSQCSRCCQSNNNKYLDLNLVRMFKPTLAEYLQQLRQQNQQIYLKSITHCYPNGADYKGQLNFQHKRQGYGQYIFQETYYMGFFKNDLPNGQGVLIKGMEKYYKGQFVEGKLEGQGKQQAEGWSFVGHYSAGYRHNGTFKCQNYEYKGQLIQNQFHGHGQLRLKDGTIYLGEFKQGKYHGQGKIFFSNKNSYSGQFQNGQYHGVGKFRWENGQIYKGDYQNGVKHGCGVYSDRLQNHIEDEWVHGLRKQQNMHSN